MTGKVPEHIAIIMDGNGRWAKQRGLPRLEGHRRGLGVIKEVIKASSDAGVKILTLYAFSSENWKRPPEEIRFLMKACESFLNRELPGLRKKNMRFRHIGRLHELSDSLQECIRHAQDETRDNGGLCVQLAFNYGSRVEILDAIKKIAHKVQKGLLEASAITEETVERCLYTAGEPDPDLLIRTSGEMRISNFLLWQMAYTEIYVTKKFWPDFIKEDLNEAIADYQKRTRRFGGLHG